MSLYEQHLEAYDDEFQPYTHHEHFLVQMLAHSRWKLERLQTLEEQLFDLVLAGAATPAQTQLLASLQKYTAAAERSYYKALKELTAGRKANLRPAHDAIMDQINAIANTPMPNIADIRGPRPEPVAPKTVTAARRL